MLTLKTAPPDLTVAATRRPTQAQYDAMVQKHLSDLRKLTVRLADGRLTPTDWADAFDVVLGIAHADAFTLGRQRAGDLSEQTLEDEIFGIGAKDSQAQYLQNFLDAIEAKDPRYWDDEGALRIEAVNNRAKLYTARLRGTANEAFVTASEPTEEFIWELGATEHCDDCIQLHALSPWTPETLYAYPGGGETDCLVNCACRLRRVRDQLYGFARTDIYLA